MIDAQVYPSDLDVGQGLRVRVLVVDDSAIVRGLISRQLETDALVRVVATAANGEIALMELARRPIDVVILDLEMPVMDGMTALPLILQAHPSVKVVIASTLSRRNAEISLRALQLGAADYIPKPEGPLAAADEFRRELIAKVRALGPRGAAAAPLAPAAPPVARAVGRPAAPAILAVAASTGGPPALLALFQSLKGAIRQPILLTQHMPAAFTGLLAEQLQRVSDRPCREGRDGETIEDGVCYIAPGGWHMTVGKGAGGAPIIRLNQDPPENFCRPAADPMLRSIAAAYGRGALAVVLTGMGSDGAKGCAAIAAAGGRFIVQDEATSVVWGMPGAAAATGLAETILPLADIGPYLRLAAEAR